MGQRFLAGLAAALVAGGATAHAADDEAETRVLLWGDTHLHTKYSGDAYAMGNRTLSPDDAFRYAKGFPVLHPASGVRVRINQPLDFLVVADHAEYMGVMQLVEQTDARLQRSEIGRWLLKNAEENRQQASFVRLGASLNNASPIEELLTEDIRRPIWEEITDIAEAHNAPGEFTALIGWEWSSLPDGANLHRVVFTPDGAEKAKQFLPFSSLTDNRPEALWAWLDEKSSALNLRFIAIPHNSNLSKGLMFSDISSDSAPVDAAYARTRMKWEPVAEILQIKGSSETHPTLSPQDEFAGHEIYEFLIDFRNGDATSAPKTSDFWRPALGRGLEIEQRVGANPYKLGAIGSTDSHSGLATAEEKNFHGKFGIDALPANKFQTLGNRSGVSPTGADYAAQGLAAVWADENSRDAIYDAFKRKEVYATSGPRISLRFFGGWDFKEKDSKRKNLVKTGYDKGVPMGGDLTAAPEGESPAFLIAAVHDPNSALLDRVQIIKGWVGEDGASNENIYDALVSGSAPELVTVWRDPDFNPTQRAYYYVRVLEQPTQRHSALDAEALGVAHPDDQPKTIRERAISSPIWYTP